MRTKSKISGYVLRSSAATLVFSCAVVGLSSATAIQRNQTLTFAERVAYQRAIEDVYWRHRVWPEENRSPKPSLDEVMSAEQIEKKVEDYLRDSQALGAYLAEADHS